PPDVGRGDEMPGRAQHMSTENRSLVHGALDRGIDGAPGPCPDAPFGAAVVLRLHGPEPAHDLSRGGQGGRQEGLSRESPLNDVVTRASHVAAFSITASRSCGARLRRSFFRSAMSAARNAPRTPFPVISNAGSSFLATVLEYRAITAR